MLEIGSFFHDKGIVIHAYTPVVHGGVFIRAITPQVQSYGHEINVEGGFVSCQITIVDDLASLEDWFENGLGRHIIVYNSGTNVIFEAFANQITFNIGAISEVKGPLLGIANRVRAIYSPKDSTVYPPVVGSTTSTLLADDTVSQALYGTIEKAISTNPCTKPEAEQARDLFLVEYAYPESVGGLNLSSLNVPSITLDCLGYINWTGVYIYNNATVGYATFSAKLQSVFAADPNGVFSTDYSYITTNAMLTGSAEYDNRYASDIIKPIVFVGDINDNRCILGCYKGRKIHYKPVPTTVRYNHHLSDPRQIIRDGTTQVDLWDIVPGEWLFVEDFLPGRSIPPIANIRRDPRYKFIESVKYNAPDSLDLSGGKTDPLSRMLAKIGSV